MVQNENKILLHACCAICSGYPIMALKELEYNPIVYFCNPNLDTKQEFNKRLEAQKTLCKNFNTELIVEEYKHIEFLESTKGLENEPEKGKRCIKCIELRLKKAAQKAKELNIPVFTTSLVISPHKNFELISKIGEDIASNYGIKYLTQNFRKNNGFLYTNNISKEFGLYRQNYCGCEFAKR